MRVLSTQIIRKVSAHPRRRSSVTHEIVVMATDDAGQFYIAEATGITYCAQGLTIAPATLAKANQAVMARFGREIDWFTCAEIDESVNFYRLRPSFQAYVAANAF